VPGISTIDPGAVFGWAHAEPGLEPLWGEQRLGKAGAEAGERFFALRLWMLDHYQEYRPQYWLYEAPFTPRPSNNPDAKQLNAQTSESLYGYTGQIQAVCWELHVECYQKPTSSFVAFMTGKGRGYPSSAAKQQAMVEACAARGWRAGHNAAHALGLLMYGESVLYPEAAMRRPKALKQPSGPLFRDREIACAAPASSRKV
jgi:hypothetical protein